MSVHHSLNPFGSDLFDFDSKRATHFRWREFLVQGLSCRTVIHTSFILPNNTNSMNSLFCLFLRIFIYWPKRTSIEISILVSLFGIGIELPEKYGRNPQTWNRILLTNFLKIIFVLFLVKGNIVVLPIQSLPTHTLVRQCHSFVPQTPLFINSRFWLFCFIDQSYSNLLGTSTHLLTRQMVLLYVFFLKPSPLWISSNIVFNYLVIKHNINKTTGEKKDSRRWSNVSNLLSKPPVKFKV